MAESEPDAAAATAPESTPPASPPAEPVAAAAEAAPPAPPPAPSVDDLQQELARERAERARLEGQLAERSRPAPPPAEPPLTPDLIEEAWSTGKISEVQRIGLHAQLAADRLLTTRAEQDRQARISYSTQARFSDYTAQYPELLDRSSPLLKKVSEAVYELRDTYGLDPNDLKTQVLGIERVVGGHRLGGPEGRDLTRRRIPVGGAPGTAATESGTSPARDPLRELPPEQIEFWKRRGYSREQMLEEAKYVNRDRWQRRRRSA